MFYIHEEATKKRKTFILVIKYIVQNNFIYFSFAKTKQIYVVIDVLRGGT